MNPNFSEVEDSGVESDGESADESDGESADESGEEEALPKRRAHENAKNRIYEMSKEKVTRDGIRITPTRLHQFKKSRKQYLKEKRNLAWMKPMMSLLLREITMLSLSAIRKVIKRIEWVMYFLAWQINVFNASVQKP